MLGFLAKFAIFGLVSITLIVAAGVTIQSRISPTSTTTVPTTLGSTTDPIVNCGPGQKSGQYIRVSKSECDNSTDCQLKDDSWKLMNKAECLAIQHRAVAKPDVSNPKIDCTGPDGKHLQITQQECNNFNNSWANNKPKQENPPSDQWQNNRINIPNYTNTYVDNSITCFVSYPCTGSNYTYRLLPSDCTDAQNRATETCRLYPANAASNLGTGSTFQLSPEVLHAGETITNQSDAWVQDMTNKYGGKPGVTCSSQGVCPAPTPAGSWFD